MRNKFILLGMLLALVSSSDLLAQGQGSGGGRSGGREGGGGQNVAADFAAYGRFVASYLGSQQRLNYDYSPFYGIDYGTIVPAYESAVNTVQIFARSTICYSTVDPDSGGIRTICLDAEYDSGQNRINVSESSWAAANCVERIVLAAHEYGRAARVEDGAYQISSRFRTGFMVSDFCLNQDRLRNRRN